MTHFMAYVVLLSAGVGACAVVVELLLRSKVLATRWVWLSALSSVLLLAVLAAFMPVLVEMETPTITARPQVVDGITAPPVKIAVERIESGSIVQIADSVLPAAWVVASVLLLLAILLGQRRLTVARRSAESRSVNGHDVLLTENLGPAVAGFARPVVFLPRWVLALDHPSQQLLLAHELEHAKRGDTRLLLAGAIAAAIMPWNPVVWWITRRLRLAVEQDCDARVLSMHPDIRRYADLLLTAASRPSVYANLLAAHFGEHRSDLDRRIQAMTDTSPKWRPALAVATVAAGLIAASCEAPRPEPLAPRKLPETVVQSGPEKVVYYERQVERPVYLEPGSASPRYPEILRQAGVEGEALVSFVVNEQGSADASSFKVIRTTHELFATAVKKALAEMRFTAAMVGGKAVKQIVIQPFSFNLPDIEPKAAETKKLAFTIRRHERELPASPPNVVIYSIEGSELARGEDLLNKIEPQSIHRIEVFKPNRCPTDLACPLIKITLAKGKTLGAAASIPPIRDASAIEAQAPESRKRIAFQLNRSDLRLPPMNYELLDSQGEILARYGSRAEVRMVNSADISASRAYSPEECAAMSGVTCPLTRIWFKPGREAAYRKR